jgi:hypothetical protein
VEAWKQFWHRIYGQTVAPDPIAAPQFSHHVVPFSLWIAAWCWAVGGLRRKDGDRAGAAQRHDTKTCKMNAVLRFASSQQVC